MGKRVKKNRAPPPPPPPPHGSSRTAAKEGEEEDFGNKLVFVSIMQSQKAPDSWIMIDPHYSGPSSEDQEDGIAAKLVPEMNIPVHIDLHIINHYGWVVCESKVYFTGGMYRHDLFPYTSTNKVFNYDLTSNKWEEGPSHLNVPRGFPTLVAIGKVLYVFGGDVHEDIEFNKEHWVEFYDLTGNKTTTTWKFLPNCNAPPQQLFNDGSINFHVVYERGNQILFFMHLVGVYSFNYVTKVWKPFHDSINKYVGRMFCYRVAVVEDVLFWHYFGNIYAYDLKNNHMLLKHPLGDFAKMNFGNPLDSCGFPGTTFLVRVGKETLLLISWDDFSFNNQKQLHCYRFRIEKSSSYQEDSSCGFRLLPDGCGFFHIPGSVLLDAVVA